MSSGVHGGQQFTFPACRGQRASQEVLGVHAGITNLYHRSEYRAHYQDHLTAGGNEDALTLFGDPAQIRQQLQEVYLTRDALEGRPNLVYLMAFSLPGLYLNAALGCFWHLQHAHLWPVLGLVVPVCVIWLWKHTWHRDPSRQRPFRALGLMTLSTTLMVFNPGPSDGLFLLRLQPFWVLASFIGGIYSMRAADARIRRTLDPAGGHQT